MYLLVISSVVAVYCFAWFLDGVSTSSEEPKHIRTRLPYIGHIVGLMRESFFYFATISQTCPEDVVTINIPGQKFYIIKSPNALHAIYKRPDVFSHDPLIAKFSARACGTSPEGAELMDRYVMGDLKEEGVVKRLYNGMRDALKPGPELDRLNVKMGQGVLEHLASYDLEQAGGRDLKLSSWMKAIVTHATTRAIYGRHNPYDDPKVLQAFWDFEGGLEGVLFSIFPSLTAKKAIAGREKVAHAIEKYYYEGHLRAEASEFARSRHREFTRAGLSELDVARYEVSGSFATFVNTSPVAFWIVRDIYNQPDLLRDLREELEAIITLDRRNGSSPTKTIDLVLLTDKCPLLVSTYREVLRRRSVGGLAKMVQEDTFVDVGRERLLLKKGAILQVPSNVFHYDERFWGQDADEFRPRRFMQGEAQKTATGKRPAESSFRAFGGGKTICPGRFFAMTELLAVVAIVILRFDISPSGGGSWPEPTSAKTNITTLFRSPDVDIPVCVKAREGVEVYQWAIKTSDE